LKKLLPQIRGVSFTGIGGQYRRNAQLSILLLIGLIIGLINPKLILRSSNNPTRLKVIGLWLITTIIVGVLGTFSEGDSEKASSNIKAAKELIDAQDYDGAISKLNNIDKDNPLFDEAQQLLQKADSFSKMTYDERVLAKKMESKLKAEKEVAVKKAQLERELKSINEGVAFSKERGSIDNLKMDLVLFSAWAKIITEGESSDDPELQKLAKQLKQKVASIQVQEFPKLRKEYANIVGRKLWENDIEVTANGTNHKYINFSGGIFAANKNIKDFQTELNDILKMFRFSQARYRWHKGASEYTYYPIYEGNDSDLVSFE
jgi:hypothetical protein